MNSLSIKSDPQVKKVIEQYPKSIQKKLFFLRDLIIKSAKELDEINSLEETLKWGEPSYLTKYGSTIRFDWKDKNPDQYALYFKCTSKLIPTFKKIFSDAFTYEKDRAILLKLNETVPEKELKKCIKSALMYHKIKHLPKL